MSLTIGSRIGPFEIIGPLGAGGMGEVYRAVDANLGRSVAVKVLPDAFALDPKRLARFEREAKTLASLNHPNIAQVFGLERGGADLRMRALVMELVEGPTLADRIANGPIPLDEAVPIAIQIAEALESAHDQGDRPPRPEARQHQGARTSPDSQRFVVLRERGAAASPALTVLVNWPASLQAPPAAMP